MSIRDFEVYEQHLRLEDFARDLNCSSTELEEILKKNGDRSTRRKVKPFKIIAFYAEKGGVGKTSNVCSVAYALTETKRVLIYDCDSQRSLSAFLLGLNYRQDVYNPRVRNPLTNYIDRIIEEEPQRIGTLYKQVMDQSMETKAAHAFSLKKNLWLVAGDRNTSKLDSEIHGEELFTSESFGAIRLSPNQMTGKIYAVIKATAEKYNVDYVLLDLSPSNGVLNRCLVMSSDYLIVSTICDFHSAEAMLTLRDMLVEWQTIMLNLIRIEQSSPARISRFPILMPRVKFMGYIINRLDSVRIGHIVNGVEDNSRGYRRVERCWLDRIAAEADLITAELSELNPPLAIAKERYIAVQRSNKIGEVREFWSFKNISDIVHVPVPFLLERHMIRYDPDTETVKFNNQDLEYRKVQRFNQVFMEICNTIQLLSN